MQLDVDVVAALAEDDLRYRPVVAAGSYDADHQFLVDNQVQDGRPGYHVLTPLRLRGRKEAVLVNRGWVPLGASRAELPELAIGRREVTITGALDRFPRLAWRLPGAERPSEGWPAVVVAPDARALGERLGYPVLPYQVLLDPTAAEGYVRAWRAIKIDPVKNRGYALQWFSFAGLLIVLFVWHGVRRRPSSQSP